MLGSIQEDHILAKDVTVPGGVIAAGGVGRLVEIIDDARVVLLFEGRGRILVSRCDILKRVYSPGQRVRVVRDGQDGGIGIVDAIWTSSSSVYMYRVRFDTGGVGSYESHYLRRIAETVEKPMNISELAKHMISVGSGCNPSTVPPWFQSVVKSLKELPQLSQMGQAQMEFVIKNHMSNRVVDTTTDLVANVMFIIQAHPSHELRKMEERLYGYQEKLNAEWKKLNVIIPVEFQYAALKAYAEYK